MVISEAIKYGKKGLKNNKYTDPINESRRILSFLLEKDISFVHMYPEYELEDDIVNKFKEIIDKRSKGYPIEYILNEKNFYGRDFYVDERVLIPRWDTEILVETVIELSKDFEKPRILEIGVGSGAVSITLGKEIKNSIITGIDVSSEAIEVSNINKNKFNVENLVLKRSDLFDKINNKYDIIVSNPPYIRKKDLKDLQDEVKKEPVLALDGGKDGLYFYEKITKNSKDYLNKNGYLIFEIGFDQYEDIKTFFEKSDFKEINYKLDYQKYKRVIYGRKV